VKDLIKGIDVLEVLADPYPESAEHYAIHVFYKAIGHRFFTCSEAVLVDKDEEDCKQEDVRLVVEGETYIVNIRTGQVSELRRRKN
jgi:hypothetical protein